MVMTILPETDPQIKARHTERLLSIVNQLPAKERAEVWQRIALTMAGQLDAAARGNT
jgi:hypothetical protein